MDIRKKYTSTLLFLLIAMLGATTFCYAETSSQAEEKSSLEEVKQETDQLLEALKSYTIEQRDEAIQMSKEALDELDRKIEELESKLADNWDKMDQAAREHARAVLKELRKKRTEVAEWYGSLKSSSEEAWVKMKKGFSDAYRALQDAWEKSEEQLGVDKESTQKDDKVAL